MLSKEDFGFNEVGSKKLNKKYAAKYRKVFTKANCGANVTVRAYED